MQSENVSSFLGCTRNGELIVLKVVEAKSNVGEFPNWNNLAVVLIDPETLHEKDIGVHYRPTTATTFVESHVLLDGANGLSG